MRSNPIAVATCPTQTRSIHLETRHACTLGLALSLLASPAHANPFDSPHAGKISTSILGVFTPIARKITCDLHGGVWESRPGDGGILNCYPPLVALTDSNIPERAAYAAWRDVCAPSQVISDSGWTTGWIKVPDHLNEYFEYQKGVVAPGLVKEVRQVVVRFWTERTVDGVKVCDAEGTRYFGFTRETITDTTLHSCSRRGNPVVVKTGEKVETKDLTAEFGVPLKFHFGSLALQPGTTGFGGRWRHNYSLRLRHTPANQDQGVQETVLINDENGDLLIFGRSGSDWANKSMRPGNLADNFDNNGVLNGWRLRRETEFLVFNLRGELIARHAAAGARHSAFYEDMPLPPYSTLQDRRLKRVADDKGREIAFDYDENSFLRSIRGNGSLVEVTQNAATRNLEKLTYPGNTSTSYFYENVDHASSLTGIQDENGDRYATFGYNQYGQAESSVHAGGVYAWRFDYYASSNYDQTVTEHDPSGAIRSWRFRRDYVSGPYSDWKTIDITQPPGSGCEQSTSKVMHDNLGNVLSRIDFTRKQSCHAFAPDRSTEVFRVEGLPDTQSCPADLASYTVRDNLPPEQAQRKISTQWHPLWKLESRRAEPKRITTTVYNGEKDTLDEDKVIACADGDPKLPDGSKIAVVCRRYEQSTGDETGNLGFDASETDRRKWSYTYNQYGQLKSVTEPRGQASGKATTYEYWDKTVFNDVESHWLGDLKSMTNTLGQTTHYLEYNKRGQVLKIQHPNGSIEQREYRPRGWLKSVKLTPNGGSTPEVTEYTYHATGLLEKATQPDGSWTLYTWDAAHRLTNVQDSAGNSVEYLLDALGNREQEIYKGPQEALAKTITRTFDALGRMDSSKGLQ